MSAFGSEATLRTATGALRYYRLSRLEELGVGAVSRLPVSIKVLLEGALRHAERRAVNGGSPEGAEAEVVALASWAGPDAAGGSVTFRPGRMVLQDFTGIPALLGLAAMRGAVQSAGGDPERVDLRVPTDLVIDHSLQVDVAGSLDARAANLSIEYERNAERFRFARWAQQAFATLRVVPPGRGIVHQVNMEFLASVVSVDESSGEPIARPDTVVGTDSHTTMIGGLGVLGWGVGGIEAEAVMLGEPIDVVLPEVVGVRLDGHPAAGVTGTDLVLALARALRTEGVVGAFVEFFGPGLDCLSLEDRATVANMAPEYGATIGYFAPDAETLAYLRRTARSPAHVDLVERYCGAQGLFRTAGGEEPAFSRVMPFDLGSVETVVAGPFQPTQTRTLAEVPESLAAALAARGRGPGATGAVPVRDGDIVIAAITSCTNTSNPAVMIGAGLLARNATERGLATPAHVKTSLAPGSPVVTDYLARAGLLAHLEKLGFAVVGYGCTTCAGGSGPLEAPVAAAIERHDLSVAAVLSGNRNFEGRIHPQCRLAYLASPPLVVAYALAGTIDIDLTSEPIAHDADGAAVFLDDLWPDAAEISRVIETSLDANLFAARADDIFSDDRRWIAAGDDGSAVPEWDPESTYIVEPPFCDGVPADPLPVSDIAGARCLLLLGDAITTDHISPAGAIDPAGPAGRYLSGRGIGHRHFGVLGARRGNHEVMVRGTFANPRLRNRFVEGREGGWTVHHPSGEVMALFDAAERYRREGTPLIIVAGDQYGAGSSRDWAAKGTALLGVRAVVAEGFERLHRQNLIAMGVLPLQFPPGRGWQRSGLDGAETYDIGGLTAGLESGGTVTLTATSADGAERHFPVTVRLDSPTEVTYYRHGGIAPYVLRRLLREAAVQAS
ncbi:MAG: aconitate hydratase AcnA [Acidimicrobiia bacterium]|nr:aconitate hydratase AcnA [Acidimicrobiia bacterium]MYC46001.1 aconitate hydratase AcnA [Acidimicrobiia bacterium]